MCEELFGLLNYDGSLLILFISSSQNVKECALCALMWWGVEVGFYTVSFFIIFFFFGPQKTLFKVSTWEYEHICLAISTGKHFHLKLNFIYIDQCVY